MVKPTAWGGNITRENRGKKITTRQVGHIAPYELIWESPALRTSPSLNIDDLVAIKGKQACEYFVRNCDVSNNKPGRTTLGRSNSSSIEGHARTYNTNAKKRTNIGGKKTSLAPIYV